MKLSLHLPQPACCAQLNSGVGDCVAPRQRAEARSDATPRHERASSLHGGGGRSTAARHMAAQAASNSRRCGAIGGAQLFCTAKAWLTTRPTAFALRFCRLRGGRGTALQVARYGLPLLRARLRCGGVGTAGQAFALAQGRATRLPRPRACARRRARRHRRGWVAARHAARVGASVAPPAALGRRFIPGMS